MVRFGRGGPKYLVPLLSQQRSRVGSSGGNRIQRNEGLSIVTQAPAAPTEASTKLLEEMFVHTARTVTSDQQTLTLHGLSPSTLYFSDRPERVVGHMTTEQFVAMWATGPNSFREDPPNAVLSYVETGSDVPNDAVVVLRDPVADDDSITYSIEILSLIHISEPTRRTPISYAVFCLKKK